MDRDPFTRRIKHTLGVWEEIKTGYNPRSLTAGAIARGIAGRLGTAFHGFISPRPPEGECFGLSHALSRRALVGAGAAALSSLVLRAQSQTDGPVMFQDSFLNIRPVAQDVLDAGIVLPPVVPLAPGDAAGQSATDSEPPTFRPNILLIIVDQLRSERWFPAGGQATLDALLPNITRLRQHSVVFNNYFVVATACSPSRSALLTGLYAQQTCMFESLLDAGDPPVNAGHTPPPLNPGFLTVGDALQPLGYQTNWIGKFHLGPPNTDLADYGFEGLSTFPGPQDLSPDGLSNEGTLGFNAYDTVPQPPRTVDFNDPPGQFWSDASIVSRFEDWLNNSAPPPPGPWFTAVSLINPHDIGTFPYSYALNLTRPADFASPAAPPSTGYQPPDPSLGVGGLQDPYRVPPIASPPTYDSTHPDPWNQGEDPSNNYQRYGYAQNYMAYLEAGDAGSL